MFGQVGVFFGWDLPVNHISFNDPAAEININRQIEHLKYFWRVTHYGYDNLNTIKLKLFSIELKKYISSLHLIKRSEANQKWLLKCFQFYLSIWESILISHRSTFQGHTLKLENLPMGKFYKSNSTGLPRDIRIDSLLKLQV